MEQLILNLCAQYGIAVKHIGDVIDTSRGEFDLRYHYIINHAYVLKINTAPMVTEEFLSGMDRTQKRYREIGIWCPRLFQNAQGNLLTMYDYNERTYRCYMEEYAPYATAEEVTEWYQFKQDMLEHLGRLASKFSGIDLIKTRSMWSIIELAPLDVEVDEKQENLNLLVQTLEEKGYNSVAKTLEKRNEFARSHIKQFFSELPRCVYQGDLNPSNILVDDAKRFAGIIDFNMYGTEVNINCFLNESMYYLEEQDFDKLTATEIVGKMNAVQSRLMEAILRHYVMNDVERQVYEDYKRVIHLGFYPNVMLWIDLLRRNKHEEKVIQLLESL